ncbi:MAG TPA: hypothetical protein H9664_03110 [Firmicutes bacterium]|nr:hypothetical protein [Bacillota bacterium]
MAMFPEKEVSGTVFQKRRRIQAVSPLRGVLRIAMFPEKEVSAQYFKNGGAFKRSAPCAAF